MRLVNADQTNKSLENLQGTSRKLNV